MTRLFILGAALFGAASVAIGAFAAHGLKASLSSYALEIIKTGAYYQLTHALALFGVALLLARTPACRRLTGAGFAFIIGVILFSGSLYALALGAPKAIGIITPLGGLALIGGWLALGMSALTATGQTPNDH